MIDDASIGFVRCGEETDWAPVREEVAGVFLKEETYGSASPGVRDGGLMKGFVDGFEKYF
jgi:hypothetical protein